MRYERRDLQAKNHTLDLSRFYTQSNELPYMFQSEQEKLGMTLALEQQLKSEDEPSLIKDIEISNEEQFILVNRNDLEPHIAMLLIYNDQYFLPEKPKDPEVQELLGYTLKGAEEDSIDDQIKDRSIARIFKELVAPRLSYVSKLKEKVRLIDQATSKNLFVEIFNPANYIKILNRDKGRTKSQNKESTCYILSYLAKL